MALSTRLPGWCAAALVAVGLASCEKLPRTEAEVAQRVLAEAAWVAHVDDCPADLMPAQGREKPLREQSCKGDALPGCFQQCERGNVTSCYWLAFTLQQKDMDDPAAQVLYQRACRSGETSGCVNRAAGMLKAKLGESAAQACSARTFDLACDRDDVWGCSMSGIAYWRGIGVPVDLDRATRQFRKTCAINGAAQHEACEVARSVLIQLEAPGGASLPPGE